MSSEDQHHSHVLSMKEVKVTLETTVSNITRTCHTDDGFDGTGTQQKQLYSNSTYLQMEVSAGVVLLYVLIVISDGKKEDRIRHIAYKWFLVFLYFITDAVAEPQCLTGEQLEYCKS